MSTPTSRAWAIDNEELGFSVDYTWNDRLELSAAYVMDGGGIQDNDIFFVGARYAVMPNARVGLNYVDVSNDTRALIRATPSRCTATTPWPTA